MTHGLRVCGSAGSPWLPAWRSWLRGDCKRRGGADLAVCEQEHAALDATLPDGAAGRREGEGVLERGEDLGPAHVGAHLLGVPAQPRRRLLLAAGAA